MKHNFLYILGGLLVITSCVDDNFKWAPAVIDGEVSFRASVRNSAATKTSYGDITDNKQEVFWVHGDEITVFGAECAVQQANYAVSVANPTTGEINKEQNYASKLDKTTPAGVQWGSVVQTDYYAVYPSTGSEFKAAGVTVEPSGTGDGGVRVSTTSATVTANISNIQKVNFNLYDTGTTNQYGKVYGWRGAHYDSDIHNPSNSGALMYSCTSGAVSTDENGNAKPVDLQFRPFSTVLRFTFDGFQVSDPNNENVDYDSEVFVNEIVLDAPTNIAGDFELTINNGTVPTAVAGEGTSDVIIVQPSVSIPLHTHQKLEFDVYTIPRTYTMGADTEDSKLMWTVTLKTSGGDYTYKMIPKKFENGEYQSTTATLLAGQIHNLSIPTLKINRPPIQIPDNSWMEYIPRNVYLSELSMPGAWYSTNPDYQGTSTLQSLYAKGVRAFNIDCRMTATASSFTRQWHGGYQLNQNPTYVLQCAGSETLTGINIFGIVYASEVKDGKTVESQLEALSTLVNDKEFISVVLTIAEKPKDLSGSISGSTETFGNNVKTANVLAAIKDILTRRGEEFKVFGYRDKDQGKTLNANTTINDVLGSMLIKINVNVDQDVTDLSSYNMANVLLCEGSMASETKYTSTGNSTDYPNIVMGSFKSMNTAPMYWGSTKISEPEMIYYYHHAQLTTSSTTDGSTTTTPSLKDRMDAVDDIVEQSYSIYKKDLHNGLFQLGIGGYIQSNNVEDRNTVATTLNQHVLDIVNEKLLTEPSPIGMVLMNYAETTGAELVKSILEMNRKFFLNRDQNQEEWPDGDPFNPESDFPDESAAYVIIGGEVF